MSAFDWWWLDLRRRCKSCRIKGGVHKMDCPYRGMRKGR